MKPFRSAFLLATITTSSISSSFANPAELKIGTFADSTMSPCPACISAHADGSLFVGVDMLGSLGKGSQKGHIAKLIDADHDGKADKKTIFANIDNPRGLIAIDDKVYVLHTVIPTDTNILSAMHLSVLTDANQDGVADGPPKHLIENISVAKHNQDRGADHTTNGIRMGIDGWIYIAVGDFGFVGAKGTDGKELTQLGGGVLRVRPDGSEMEVYTHGLRNIYDVAIDPYLNMFTRGNTNDGGGWNVRFIHHIQTGEYGYPILFKNFTDEIIPALVDLGGGSGTGSLFFQEPNWPEQLNNVPMMCDWGRSHTFIHRLTPDGASFKQAQENFIQSGQPTDIDVDGSGRLFISDWDGAGYSGNPNRGKVISITPKDWSYKAFPALRQLKNEELIALVNSPSATARLNAQQEILRRADTAIAESLFTLASDKSATTPSRIAAIFTYKQLLGEKATANLVKLCADESVREWTLRALTDRLSQQSAVPLDPFYAGLKDTNPRVQVAAAVALGRLGKLEAAKPLLSVALPPKSSPVAPGQEGPHATPNSAVILPHVAVHSLVKLQAIDDCLAAVNSPSQDGALWALRLIHDEKVVDGLIAQLNDGKDPQLKIKLLTALARLYSKEAPYDGSWWWNTRPDTRGPYYVPVTWSASPKIEQVFRQTHQAGDDITKATLAALATKHRMNLEGIGEVEVKQGEKKATVGMAAVEDVIIHLNKHKGNPDNGKAVLLKQACIACHSIEDAHPKKGPDLNKIGAQLNREAIAMAILRPDASIAANWVDVTLKDATVVQGTLVSQDDQKTVVRNIAGITTDIPTANVKSVAKSPSTLMGPKLLDQLTLDEFVDVIDYLSSKK